MVYVFLRLGVRAPSSYYCYYLRNLVLLGACYKKQTSSSYSGIIGMCFPPVLLVLRLAPLAGLGALVK